MANTSVSHPAYRWVLVAMLWFVCFFNYADRQAIFSVFPLLRTSSHLTNVQLGVVGSSFMWAYALCGPIAGWLTDRVSRKALVLGGLIFWSVVTGLTALTNSYAQLVACRALGGLGEALYFPASMALIAEYHGAKTRSRAMAFHQSSVYVGSIAGGAISGYVGQTYGWRNSFVLFGVAGIVLGAVLWVFIREPRRSRSEPEAVLDAAQDALPSPVAASSAHRGFLRPMAEILSLPPALVLIAVFIGANFVAVVFLTWLPTFLVDKFHMSLASAGFSGTAYLQIASILGVVLGGMLADAMVARMPAQGRGRIRTQAVGLLCGVPFLFLAGQARTLSLLFAALTGFGFFKGLYDANLWAALYDVIPSRGRGTAVGLMNSLGWLGGGAAPLVVAAEASRFGFSLTISATAAVYLACGTGMLVLSVHARNTK